MSQQEITKDKEETDQQKINWGNNIKHKIRWQHKTRNQQIQPLLSNAGIQLKKYQYKFQIIEEEEQYYIYEDFYEGLDPTLNHTQLHDCVKAASLNDIFYFKNQDISYFNTVSQSGYGFNQSDIDPCCMGYKKHILAVGGLKSDIAVYDVQNQIKIIYGKITNGDNDYVNCVKLAPMANYSSHMQLLVGCNDCTIKNYDLNKISSQTLTTPLHQIQTDTCVNYVSLNKDHSLLAMYCDKENAEILDLRSQKIIVSLGGHQDYGFTLDWEPTLERQIVTGNQDATTRVWDIRRYQSELYILQSENFATHNVLFSRDGMYLFVAEAMDYVQIYNAENNYQQYQKIEFFGEVTGIALSPDELSQVLFIGVQINDHNGVLKYQRQQKEKFESLLENAFV